MPRWEVKRLVQAFCTETGINYGVEICVIRVEKRRLALLLVPDREIVINRRKPSKMTPTNRRSLPLYRIYIEPQAIQTWIIELHATHIELLFRLWGVIDQGF